MNKDIIELLKAIKDNTANQDPVEFPYIMPPQSANLWKLKPNPDVDAVVKRFGWQDPSYEYHQFASPTNEYGRAYYVFKFLIHDRGQRRPDSELMVITVSPVTGYDEYIHSYQLYVNTPVMTTTTEFYTTPAKVQIIQNCTIQFYRVY